MGLSKLVCYLLFLVVLVRGVEQDKFTNSHGPLTFGARFRHRISSEFNNGGQEIKVEENRDDGKEVKSSPRFQTVRSQRLNRLTSLQIKRDEEIKEQKDPSKGVRNIRRKSNRQILKNYTDISENKGKKLDVITIKPKPAPKNVNTPEENNLKGVVENLGSNDKSISVSRKLENVVHDIENRKEEQLAGNPGIRKVSRLAIKENNSDSRNQNISQNERRTLIFRTHRKTKEQEENIRKENRTKLRIIPNDNIALEGKRRGLTTILKNRNINLGHPEKLIHFNPEDIKSMSNIPQRGNAKGSDNNPDVISNVLKEKADLNSDLKTEYKNSEPHQSPIKLVPLQMEPMQKMKKSLATTRRKLTRKHLKQLDSGSGDNKTKSSGKNGANPTTSHEMIRIRKLKGAKLDNTHFHKIEKIKGERTLKPSNTIRKRINKGRGRIRNLPQEVNMEIILDEEQSTAHRKSSNKKIGIKMLLDSRENDSDIQNKDSSSVRPVNRRNNRIRKTRPHSTLKTTNGIGRGNNSNVLDYVITKRNNRTKIDETLLKLENFQTEIINKTKNRRTNSSDKARVKTPTTAQQQKYINSADDDIVILKHSVNISNEELSEKSFGEHKKLPENDIRRRKMKIRKTSQISDSGQVNHPSGSNIEMSPDSPRILPFTKRRNKLRNKNKVEFNRKEQQTATAKIRERNQGFESSFLSEKIPEKETEHGSPTTVNVTLNPKMENENSDYSDYIDIAINHAQITWSQDPFRGSSSTEENRPVFDIDYSKDPTLLEEEERETHIVTEEGRKLQNAEEIVIFSKNKRRNKARKTRQ